MSSEQVQRKRKEEMCRRGLPSLFWPALPFSLQVSTSSGQLPCDALQTTNRPRGQRAGLWLLVRMADWGQFQLGSTSYVGKRALSSGPVGQLAGLSVSWLDG